MDCIVHGIAMSWTWLSDFHFIVTCSVVVVSGVQHNNHMYIYIYIDTYTRVYMYSYMYTYSFLYVFPLWFITGFWIWFPVPNCLISFTYEIMGLKFKSFVQILAFFQLFITFTFLSCCVACRILVPQPGTEPVSLYWEHGVLTTSKVPEFYFFETSCFI